MLLPSDNPLATRIDIRGFCLGIIMQRTCIRLVGITFESVGLINLVIQDDTVCPKLVNNSNISCEIFKLRVYIYHCMNDDQLCHSGAERRLSFSGGARQLFADKRAWLARY